MYIHLSTSFQLPNADSEQEGMVPATYKGLSFYLLSLHDPGLAVAGIGCVEEGWNQQMGALCINQYISVINPLLYPYLSASQRLERPFKDWEKLFAMHITNDGLIPKISKELLQHRK